MLPCVASLPGSADLRIQEFTLSSSSSRPAPKTMARSVKTPADNVGVVEISSDDKGATVTTAASDMSNSEKTPATGAHEPSVKHLRQGRSNTSRAIRSFEVVSFSLSTNCRCAFWPALTILTRCRCLQLHCVCSRRWRPFADVPLSGVGHCLHRTVQCDHHALHLQTLPGASVGHIFAAYVSYLI